MRFKIVSDSTCDLPQALVHELNIGIFPLTVIKDGKEYKDNVTITPTEIFTHVVNGGDLCSTSAGNLNDYIEFFGSFANEYDGILHISLGSGFSSSYQNACLAASEFDNVRVVDSQNLSTGHGLIVMKACELADKYTDLDQLQQAVQAFTPKVEASFLLDQLKYMVKGGRCSAAAALGANLLNLKPCIEVRDGKMSVVKKYRGTYSKCLANYVKDRLDSREDVDRSLVFLTYTPVADDCLDAVKTALDSYANTDNLVESNAGCTVSCHCGPGTLGVLFLRK